jgi:hypothetical protein
VQISDQISRFQNGIDSRYCFVSRAKSFASEPPGVFRGIKRNCTILKLKIETPATASLGVFVCSLFDTCVNRLVVVAVALEVHKAFIYPDPDN